MKAYSTNGCGGLIRIQIDLYLSPYRKFKSKCIKNLNIKPDTLNLTEKKVGNSLEPIGTGEKVPEQNTHKSVTKINS